MKLRSKVVQIRDLSLTHELFCPLMSWEVLFSIKIDFSPLGNPEKLASDIYSKNSIRIQLFNEISDFFDAFLTYTRGFVGKI